MKIKSIIIVLGLLLIGATLKAQNQFHLTQYMLHQPFINPASMGAFNNFNGALFYKAQWVSFKEAPRLQGFNVNSPLKDGRNHLGLSFINDKIGIHTSMDISANYAYGVPIGTQSKLSFGLSAALKLVQSDYSTLETISPDPEFQEDSPLLAMPNFKFGTYIHHPRFYIGAAIPNLLKNDVLFTGQFQAATEFDINDMHFYLHGGYIQPLGDKMALKSSMLIKQVAGAPIQFDINTLLDINNKIGFGLAYRTSQEASAMVQIGLIKYFKLAYAYDFNFSEINDYSSGTHEIMLIFDLVNDKDSPVIEVPRY